MRIIDTHMHYGVYEGLDYVSETFERVLDVTRAAGTNAHIFVSTFEQLVPYPVSAKQIIKGNEDLLEKVSKEPDCWMMAVIQPEMPEVMIQAAQLIRDKKCLGVKCGPEYHHYEMAGQAGQTIFEFLSTHDVPAIIHTGSSSYDNPGSILPLAEEYPQAHVLLAHFNSLFPPTRHAELLSRHNCPNVWLGYDHCACICYGVLEACTKLVGAERIIYGSDMPCYYPRPLIDGILDARLSDTERQLILADNAERFLGQELINRSEVILQEL